MGVEVTRAVAVSVQSQQVGLATPRVGVGPRARESGDRRARGANVAPLGADCTMSIVRTHASGRGFARERRRDVGSALRGACPLGSHVRGRSSHGVAMRLEIGTEGSRSGRSTPSGRACFAPTEVTLVLHEVSLSRSGAYLLRQLWPVRGRVSRRDGGPCSTVWLLILVWCRNRRRHFIVVMKPKRWRPPVCVNDRLGTPGARDEWCRSRRGTVSTWHRDRWLVPPEVRRT